MLSGNLVNHVTLPDTVQYCMVIQHLRIVVSVYGKVTKQFQLTYKGKNENKSKMDLYGIYGWGQYPLLCR